RNDGLKHRRNQVATAQTTNEILEVTTQTDVKFSDFSMMDLFLSADPVVKLVMAALVLASVWCWAIIIGKWGVLKRINMRANSFDIILLEGKHSLMTIYHSARNNPNDPMSRVFVSGMETWINQKGNRSISSEQEPLHEALMRMMSQRLEVEVEWLEKNMTVLATTASAGPFIGLFGTVCGIMNAFTSIANTKQTSLAVVAPGIAEALFATALGLIAAIPATIAYNKINADIARYGNRLDHFIGNFCARARSQPLQVNEGVSLNDTQQG
ncbi:MAG: protein TolQ, partial [Pseudomonadota bacterium]